MKSIDKLVEAYLDDRDALSSKELERLAAELDRSPALAGSLKDQLVVRELVSQKLAEDRRNFNAQVAQRRRDFERGEDALLRQAMEVRSLVSEELQDGGKRARSRRAAGFWMGLALALTVLVAAGLFWDRIVPPPAIAQVAAVEGAVLVERNGRQTDVAAGGAIRRGDRLMVGQDAAAEVHYTDRTKLLLDSDATVQFEGGAGEAKRVVLAAGGLSALVVPQPAETPMTIESEAGVVRVVGTELFVYSSDAGLRVGVTKGRIVLSRRSDGEEAEIAAGNSGFASADVLQVWQGIWPTNLTGAELVIESAPKMQAGGYFGAPQPVTLVPQGRARLSEHGALVLDDGAFLAEGAGPAIVDACRASGELTLEAILRSNQGEQNDTSIIFAAGDSPATPNIALTQSAGRLGFLLKTSHERDMTVVDLADVAEESPQQLVVTYRPGRLACYLDGRLLIERTDVTGDFQTWSHGDLIFGDRLDGGHNWRGVLEGVAIYNRALGKNEIARNAAAYGTILDQRRLFSASDQPTAKPE